MVNWYYVQGSERMGPVGVEKLKNLFLNAEINLDSYVWRKGFQNWERLKDVTELDFSKPEVEKPKIERRADLKVPPKIEEESEKNVKAKVKEPSSPEITFSFEWRSIRNEEELFFIKVGSDRKTVPDSKFFGPYSLNELRDAISDKRINNKTLIFAAGMPGWVEIGDTPLDPKNFSLNTDNVIDEAPLLIVLENEPLPIIALLEEAGMKKCKLLSSGPFQKGKVLKCSMYSGSVLKATNLKLNIVEYRPREQEVICNIVEMNETAKKIMQNYAD